MDVLSARLLYVPLALISASLIFHPFIGFKNKKSEEVCRSSGSFGANGGLGELWAHAQMYTGWGGGAPAPFMDQWKSGKADGHFECACACLARAGSVVVLIRTESKIGRNFARLLLLFFGELRLRLKALCVYDDEKSLWALLLHQRLLLSSISLQAGNCFLMQKL